MPQAATIKSLPAAFAMMKAMQAEDVEWGEDYRAAARDALAKVLEGRMDQLIDAHLERMAEARPRRPAQWLLHALAADRARRHRAGGAAHADLQRAEGGARLRQACQGRR